MVRDEVGRLMSRPFSAGLVLCLTALGSGSAFAQSTSRPPAEKPTTTAPAAPPAATARAPSGTSASRPSVSSGSGGGYNPGGHSGGGSHNAGGNSGSGGGYNPGGNSGIGGGHNPGGSSGGSGYNPGGSSGSGGYNPGGSSGSGGYNPGGNSGGGGYNPGGNSGSGGSGYNPGASSSRPDYNPGGAWNGATGEGWNPGNYYQRSVIQGWVRLGFAEAGKGADKDIIQAYGRYRYSRIKLCVRVADVAFYDAQVQFEHGGKQDIRVQSRVKRGQCTREYYLRGGKRLDIRYVYLFFRQADNITNWRTARVDLYAR